MLPVSLNASHPISSGPSPQSWGRAPRRRSWSVLLVGGLVLGPVLFVGAVLSSASECIASRRSLMLRTLEDALKLHRAKTGRYPTTEEGLEALVGCGALKELPTDFWGRPFFYALIRGRPMVWTFGRDGVPGGEGEDADLYNVSWREPHAP